MRYSSASAGHLKSNRPPEATVSHLLDVDAFKGDGRHADNADMAEVGTPPSLHYVDGEGQPLNVRRLYRGWVASATAATAFAGYAAFADRKGDRFSLGVWESIAAIAALLAVAYLVAWWDDKRQATESRDYWVRRNAREARRAVGLGALGLAATVLGLALAIRANHTYLAGLLIPPALAALTWLVLGLTVRQRQRNRTG
jgi:hypothetical protein